MNTKVLLESLNMEKKIRI